MKQKYSYIVFVFSLAILLTSCGSGGSGGDTSGISYTGVKNQATITKDNAKQIAVGAYQNGSRSLSVGSSVGVVQDGEPVYISLPRVLLLSQAIDKTFRRLDVTSFSGSIISGVTQSDSIDGDCGGKMSARITYDDVTGDFTGSINFANYCDSSNTLATRLSGSMSVSGTLDVDTLEPVELSVSFSNFKVTSDSDSYTSQGNITYNSNAVPISVNIDMDIRDDSTDMVYKVEGYKITITDHDSYVDVTVTGKYYDPDYGYANLSTLTPLRIYYNADWPSQGVLVATGTSISKARLTVVSDTSFRVEADTDGDGAYDDWNSGNLSWSSL